MKECGGRTVGHDPLGASVMDHLYSTRHPKQHLDIQMWFSNRPYIFIIAYKTPVPYKCVYLYTPGAYIASLYAVCIHYRKSAGLLILWWYSPLVAVPQWEKSVPKKLERGSKYTRRVWEKKRNIRRRFERTTESRGYNNNNNREREIEIERKEYII